MTNKEAIEHLKNINSRYPCSLDTTFQDECEMIALNLAIKALEERPKGEWIEGEEWEDSDGGWGWWQKCSVCRESIHSRKNFCPNCGADMRGDA